MAATQEGQELTRMLGTATKHAVDDVATTLTQQLGGHPIASERERERGREREREGCRGREAEGERDAQTDRERPRERERSKTNQSDLFWLFQT